MITRPSVSVIIPTYNRSEYLGEAVASIQAQSQPPQNIIVVDDGSTDDTSRILESFGSSIRVLRKENGGKSSALNLALQHVDTEYVWFFDDDDIACPDFLETHLSYITPDSGFTFAPHIPIVEKPDGRFVEGDKVDLTRVGEGNIFSALLWDLPFMMGSMLIRTEYIQKIGAFDEALIRSQDYDYMLRLAHKCHATHVDHVAYKRRKHIGERGSGGSTFLWSEAERMWFKYEQHIFRKLYRTIPLMDYLPRNESAGVGARRAASLTRFALQFRAGNWDLAQCDLLSYLEFAQQSSLTDYEEKVCWKAGDSPRWGGMVHKNNPMLIFRELQGNALHSVTKKMCTGAIHKLRRDWHQASFRNRFSQMRNVMKLYVG